RAAGPGGELPGAEQPRGGGGVRVWLANFPPAVDAKAREPVTAPLDASQVPVNSQLRRGEQPLRRGERREMLIRAAAAIKDCPRRVNRVLRERDCRKPPSECAGARALPRPRRPAP